MIMQLNEKQKKEKRFSANDLETVQKKINDERMPLLQLAIEKEKQKALKEMREKFNEERLKFYDEANATLENVGKTEGILRAWVDQSRMNNEHLESAINKIQTKQEELEKVTNTLDRQTDLLERLTNLMEKIISEKFPKYSI